MKFDDILLHLGEFGRYQKQQVFLVGMVIFSVGAQIMMTVFTLYSPGHRCAPQGTTNDSLNMSTENFSSTNSLLFQHGSGHVYEYSKCHVYIYLDDHEHGRNNPSEHDLQRTTNITYLSLQNATRRACEHWVYEKDDFTSTLTTQMDFVCDQKNLKSYALMGLMSGQMAGCVFGSVADVVGRKKVALVSLVIHFLASTLIAVSTSFYMLTILFFINGTAMAGAYISLFTNGMEVIGLGWRHVTGIAMNIFWAVGMLWVCLLAFLLRDWQSLQLAVSCPIVLFGLYVFFLQESARWLILKGRYPQAEVIITLMAETNGVDVPDLLTVEEKNDNETGAGSESILTLLKYPSMLLRAFIVWFNWFVCSLTYYGLNLNVGRLSGDIFLNFFFAALFEIASLVLVIFALSRLGRKFIYCFLLLFGAVACLLTVLPAIVHISMPWLVRMLAMVGKFGVSGAFAVIWVFTSEMFPTSLRASVTGASSCCGRLGAVAAAYVANLTIGGASANSMPQIFIFGSAGVVAGLLALLLPETNNRRLPESFLDAVRISRNANGAQIQTKDHIDNGVCVPMVSRDPIKNTESALQHNNTVI